MHTYRYFYLLGVGWVVVVVMVVCSFGMTAKIKLLHLFTILNQSSWQKAGVRRRKRRRGWQQIDVCPVMRSRHTQTHSPDSMKRKQQFFSSVCGRQHAQLTNTFLQNDFLFIGDTERFLGYRRSIMCTNRYSLRGPQVQILLWAAGVMDLTHDLCTSCV